MPALPGREADPPHREHPQEMPVGEHRHRALPLPQPGQHAVGALGNLLHRLALRAAVLKHIPTRARGVNLGARPAFIIAVIPFMEIRVHLRHTAEAGQFAGAPGPLERAGEDPGERESLQDFPELRRAAFALGGERQVGAARMAARKRPRRFTVPKEIDLRGHAREGGPGGFQPVRPSDSAE